jgi:hypothetical protein
MGETSELHKHETVKIDYLSEGLDTCQWSGLRLRVWLLIRLSYLSNVENNLTREFI